MTNGDNTDKPVDPLHHLRMADSLLAPRVIDGEDYAPHADDVRRAIGHAATGLLAELTRVPGSGEGGGSGLGDLLETGVLQVAPRAKPAAARFGERPNRSDVR